MTRDEILKILESCLPVAEPPYDLPPAHAWSELTHRLGMQFPREFVEFMELLTCFEFPGDIYNISKLGRTNGNDTIADVYDFEVSHNEFWPSWLVPFYGIGNGDYFGFDMRTSTESEVLYWYHEVQMAKRDAASFAQWVERLPAFLSGDPTENSPGK